MGRLVRHLRGNLVAYVALFSSLCLGGAWAATELGKNDVKSRHIGKGQVKTRDLAKNAVRSAKVRDGSLLERDFGPGELPVGPPGAPGPPGDDGTPGPPGPTFGSFSAKGPDPVANPDSVPPSTSARRHDFTLPSSGRVLAMVGSSGFRIDCDDAGDPATAGLYVDGVPIEGTRQSFADNMPEPITAFGLSQALAPGDHDVSVATDCTTGAPGNMGIGFPDDFKVGVVLLGG